MYSHAGRYIVGLATHYMATISAPEPGHHWQHPSPRLSAESQILTTTANDGLQWFGHAAPIV